MDKDALLDALDELVKDHKECPPNDVCTLWDELKDLVENE